MLDRKKIVGGAQRRSQGRMLYQGSLNLGDRSWKIEDGKSKQFFISLAEQLAPDVALIEEKERWLEAAHQLSCQRYRLAEWTEKR
ncbi:MAG: hypothetical protein FJ390_04700 [Verrucomicrobia bacterium]|nr:hypothetical protein [Verrucomicrobiota bacterium]